MVFYGVRNLTNRDSHERTHEFFTTKGEAMDFIKARELDPEHDLQKITLTHKSEAVEFCKNMMQFPVDNPEHFAN